MTKDEILAELERLAGEVLRLAGIVKGTDEPATPAAATGRTMTEEQARAEIQAKGLDATPATIAEHIAASAGTEPATVNAGSTEGAPAPAAETVGTSAPSEGPSTPVPEPVVPEPVVPEPVVPEPATEQGLEGTAPIEPQGPQGPTSPTPDEIRAAQALMEAAGYNTTPGPNAT